MRRHSVKSLEMDNEMLERLDQFLKSQDFHVRSRHSATKQELKKLRQNDTPYDNESLRQIQLAEAELREMESHKEFREAFEIIIGNARTAVLNLVRNGEQSCRNNPHLTRNQYARAEVAQHFSSTLLERLNKPATASSSDILHELNRALSYESSLKDVLSEANTVQAASEAILADNRLAELPTRILPEEQSAPGTAERYIDQVVFQSFFVRLKKWLMIVANGSSAILWAFLDDLEVSAIPSDIDWPRALPSSHEIPGINTIADGLISRK